MVLGMSWPNSSRCHTFYSSNTKRLLSLKIKLYSTFYYTFVVWTLKDTLTKVSHGYCAAKAKVCPISTFQPWHFVWWPPRKISCGFLQYLCAISTTDLWWGSFSITKEGLIRLEQLTNWGKGTVCLGGPQMVHRSATLTQLITFSL